MKGENSEQQIHIGSIIKEVAKKKGISGTQLAQKINCVCSNMNDIYSRSSIQTDQLWKISEILDYNFFTEIFGKSMNTILRNGKKSGITTIVISNETISIENNNGTKEKTIYSRNHDK
jgi:ribosome-binding protein aMBF1 (putative translation factor)